MATYNFKNLEVWQKSISLTKKVYGIVNGFPEYEKFGLTNQIRRAMVSVSSNIAEGSARLSAKDQAKFYQYAYSSLIESISQLNVAVELGYLERTELEKLNDELEKHSKKRRFASLMSYIGDKLINIGNKFKRVESSKNSNIESEASLDDIDINPKVSFIFFFALDIIPSFVYSKYFSKSQLLIAIFNDLSRLLTIFQVLNYNIISNLTKSGLILLFTSQVSKMIYNINRLYYSIVLSEEEKQIEIALKQFHKKRNRITKKLFKLEVFNTNFTKT